jgi:hypothetical protein
MNRKRRIDMIQNDGWKEEVLVMSAARHSKEKQVSAHKHL